MTAVTCLIFDPARNAESHGVAMASRITRRGDYLMTHYRRGIGAPYVSDSLESYSTRFVRNYSALFSPRGAKLSIVVEPSMDGADCALPRSRRI